jgi:hypothetical protein
MAAGIPIRLVQENHNTIELDATSMTLSTSRKVGGMAIPFTGSKRIGMDLNINSAMINIQGIIADDREGTKSTAHSATINFGKTHSQETQWNTTSNLSGLSGQTLKIQKFDTGISSGVIQITFTPAGTTTSNGVTSSGASTMNLTSAADFSASGSGTIDGDGFTWTGKSTNQLTGVSGVSGTKADDVTVIQTSTTADILSAGRIVYTSTLIPSQLVAALVTYINTNHASFITASAVSGVDYNDVTSNCILNIVMTTLGKNTTMARTTPLWKGSGDFWNEPITQTFAGGSDGGKKSAGDKTMDLYGIINNSKSRGHTTTIINKHILQNSRTKELKDYIIGLQIPYNSTLKATGGDEYVARNFFMPTGNYDGLDKTSEGNNLPASVTFDTGEERTGIQGSVQKFDITYDAGESVYKFNMIFAPIDNLILS